MSSPNTIKYNVGGKIYEVSADVINKHPHSMLSRILSKEWTNHEASNDIIIFINGNADRFQYCLDYLIRGRVKIPRHISRDSVLDDLDYYGIQVEDRSDVMECATSMYTILEAQKCEVNLATNTCSIQLEIAAAKRLFVPVAYTCHFHMLSTGESRINIDEQQMPTLFDDSYNKLIDHTSQYRASDFLLSNYKCMFQDHLKEYGLFCTNIEDATLSNIELGTIPDERECFDNTHDEYSEASDPDDEDIEFCLDDYDEEEEWEVEEESDEDEESDGDEELDEDDEMDEENN